MDVTSNFDLQKKDYYEIAPHNHRIKSKTKNNNIDWSLTKYDILNKHPTNFRLLMIHHWGAYALIHDLKRIKSGHPDETYSNYSWQENNHIVHQILKSAKGKSLQQRINNSKSPYLAKELLNPVKGMFQRKNKTGYRTIETGFGRGTNHKNQIGSDRKKIWQQIKKAYPKLNGDIILRSEASGLNQVPKNMNQMMPGFQITDYDVHVDEKKNYFGQAHLQGRMALLGTTQKGKPSFNLNNAIKASVNPHKKLLKLLDKKYYPKNYGTKKDHMNFKNNVGRFHAFNMLTSYITFKTVSHQLEHDFPKAKLNFHLIRTYAPSINHDEYIHHQDQKQQVSSSINRITKKAKQHLQKSYASSKASWLNKKQASLSQMSTSITSSAQSIQSSATIFARSVSVSVESSASQAVSQAWNNIHQHESLIDHRNINLLTKFMSITQAHNPNVRHHNYSYFAKVSYKNGLTYPNGQSHSGDDLMTRQQSEATNIINQRFNTISYDESVNSSNISSANQVIHFEKNASITISSEANEAAADRKDLEYEFISKKRQLNRDKKRIKHFKVARRRMMQQQFSLIVPKSYQVKGESRAQMINYMARGVGFKGGILGDKKFHSGFDLEVHFVGYDIQHGLDANVQEAKNEIDDYKRNTYKGQKGFSPSDSDDTPTL